MESLNKFTSIKFHIFIWNLEFFELRVTFESGQSTQAYILLSLSDRMCTLTKSFAFFNRIGFLFLQEFLLSLKKKFPQVI